jgi:hypothetical protein
MLKYRRQAQQMSNEIVELGRQLVEHKLLIPGVTVSARIPTKGFGHAIMTVELEGTVMSANANGVKIHFSDRKPRITKFEELTAIEGMDLPRFAQAYRIKTATKKKKR